MAPGDFPSLFSGSGSTSLANGNAIVFLFQTSSQPTSPGPPHSQAVGVSLGWKRPVRAVTNAPGLEGGRSCSGGAQLLTLPPTLLTLGPSFHQFSGCDPCLEPAPLIPFHPLPILRGQLRTPSPGALRDHSHPQSLRAQHWFSLVSV